MQDITSTSACEVVGSTLADINEMRYMRYSVQRQVTRVNFRQRKMHFIFIYEAQTTKLWSGIGRLYPRQIYRIYGPAKISPAWLGRAGAKWLPPNHMDEPAPASPGTLKMLSCKWQAGCTPERSSCVRGALHEHLWMCELRKEGSWPESKGSRQWQWWASKRCVSVDLIILTDF